MAPRPSSTIDILSEASPSQIDLSNPLLATLSWCRVFDARCSYLGPQPLYSKFPAFGDVGNFTAQGGAFGPGPAGFGMTGTDTGGSMLFQELGSNNQIPLGTRGTLAIFSTLGFAPADSVTHWAFNIGNTSASNPCLEILKLSDNNWYMGPLGAADSRVIVAATGTYNQGDDAILGVTWTPSTVTGYVKGKVIGTHAMNDLPNVTGAGNRIILNSLPGGDDDFCRSKGTIIYWAAIWERDLSLMDFTYLQANPWAMFRQQLEPTALFTGSGGAAAGQTNLGDVFTNQFYYGIPT